MIGCIPIPATRKPFHNPHSKPAPSAAKIASAIGVCDT